MSNLDHYYETMGIANTLRGYDSYDPEYKAALEDLAETFLSESRRLDDSRMLEESRMQEERLADDNRRMDERRQEMRMQEDRQAYEKRQAEKRAIEEKKPEEVKKSDDSKISEKLSKNVKLGQFHGVSEIDGRKCAMVENIVKMKGYQWNNTYGCLEKKDFYVRTGTYTAFDLETGKKINDRLRMEESQVTKTATKSFAVDGNGRQHEMHGKVITLDGAKIAVNERIDKDTGVPIGQWYGVNVETGEPVQMKFVNVEERQVTERNIERAAISKRTGKVYVVLPPSETDKVKAEIRIQQEEEYKQKHTMSR